jgi:hypothetical protein
MSICCSNLYVKPLLKDIKEQDYLTPYKLLSSILKIDYFKNQIKNGKINDDIFLKYLMCRPKMRIYIFDKQQDFIEEFVNVAYYKKIVLNQKKYNNLVLQLKSITQKFDDIKIRKQQVHHLHMFFTEEDISKKYELKDNLELFYQSKTFIETVINSKLLLNENSLKYLEYQRFDKIISFKTSILKFNKFMVWIYKNLTLLDLEYICVWSGMLSFTFGIREFSDIDMHIYQNNYYNTLYKKFNKFDIHGIELDIPGDYNTVLSSLKPNQPFKLVEKYTNDIKIDSIKIFNKNSTLIDIYFNHNYYYYFYGLKFVNLSTQFYWRYTRQRPAPIADLIAFKLISNINVPIPEVPNMFYNCLRFYNMEDMVNTMPNEYKYYYNVYKDYPNIINNVEKNYTNKKKFYSTIKFYLKTKYKINLNLEQIELFINKNTVTNMKDFKEIVSKI